MYSDRYVAFVDILGFSEIVRKTEHDQIAGRVDALAEALTAIGSHHPTLNESDDFQFQTFADSIVMSSAATLTGLLHIFHSITELNISLLKPGLLTRGAVARGKLYHDRSVMFGPALLSAYAIETTVAKYPRVVLSREVYQDFQRVKSAFKIPRVRLADDGPPFLDVFAQFAMLNETEPTIDFLNSEEVLEAQARQRSIQNLVDDSIYEPKHYEKLLWLAMYWNRVVAQGGQRRALEQIVLPIVRDHFPDFDFGQGRK
jgi:hypothetical protein